MYELTDVESTMVGGGRLTFNEGAGLILALGAIGGPATLAFAFPIAFAMYQVSIP